MLVAPMKDLLCSKATSAEYCLVKAISNLSYPNSYAVTDKNVGSKVFACDASCTGKTLGLLKAIQKFVGPLAPIVVTAENQVKAGCPETEQSAIMQVSNSYELPLSSVQVEQKNNLVISSVQVEQKNNLVIYCAVGGGSALVALIAGVIFHKKRGKNNRQQVMSTAAL